MLFLRFRPTLSQIHALRDRADRLGVLYLERLAVAGTISRNDVIKVADALNRSPREMIEMIPDRRRERRHAKAVAGLRKAGLMDVDEE